MKELGYFFAKIKYRLCGNSKEAIADYFRKAGMIVGKNCNICCNIMTNEPYLVEIGDNVTISGNVTFVTHDNSVSKIVGPGNDLFGKIVIGNNCFIGMGTTILYGVSIPCNTIVAAGSVVIKSISKEGCIVGGNPARIVGSVDAFAQKVEKNVIATVKMTPEERKKTVLESSDRWIKRKDM